jgi:hypothetical protein
MGRWTTDATEQYMSSPGSQCEAAQHCIAAVAYTSLDIHRQEANGLKCDSDSPELLKHNGLAISMLKEDVTSGRAATDAPSTINTIFMLSYLAVRLSIRIRGKCRTPKTD